MMPCVQASIDAGADIKQSIMFNPLISCLNDDLDATELFTG